MFMELKSLELRREGIGEHPAEYPAHRLTVRFVTEIAAEHVEVRHEVGQKEETPHPAVDTASRPREPE